MIFELWKICFKLCFNGTKGLEKKNLVTTTKNRTESLLYQGYLCFVWKTYQIATYLSLSSTETKFTIIIFCHDSKNIGFWSHYSAFISIPVSVLGIPKIFWRHHLLPFLDLLGPTTPIWWWGGGEPPIYVKKYFRLPRKHVLQRVRKCWVIK